MIELGYSLSCEEHPAPALVDFAVEAERCGFAFAMISDHFHPWTDKQGESPFAWSVIGAIANATSRLRLGTAVTCPTMRYHPALIAQAAATAAQLMPGRFMLGLGTGENLNEHVFGYRWPSGAVRLSMLEEAIGIIRMLWQDGWHSHHGEHYTIENARVYSLPDENPPILLAAGAKRSAQAAGRLSDGLISTQPNPSTVEQFESAGGEGKPRFGQLTVCYARDEQEAVRTALEVWPNGAITGQASWELPLPRHFEQLGKLVSEDDVKESIVCGPNPDKHLSAIKEFSDAGFDHVFVHQIGHDQRGFFKFYREKIIPELKRTRASATAVHAPHAGNNA